MAKYKAYPEYKDSGVEWLGELPAHWTTLAIKHVAQLNPSKSCISIEKMKGMCSFIPMEKLKFNSLCLDEIKDVTDVYNGYTYFENEDILMAKVTPCFENKNMVVAHDLNNGIGFGSSEIYVLRCNDIINNDFLFYRLQEDNFMSIAEGAMTGAGGLKRVPSEILNNFKFGLPSKKEQSIIVDFLKHETAKIDNLIEKQQQLIELLKEKRQAVISHAVTKGLNPDVPMKDSGVEWLGEIPAHWTIPSLKYNISTRKGVAFKSSDFCDAGIRVVKASDIKKKTIISSDVFLPVCFSKEYPKAVLNFGDIVLSTVGSTPDVKNSAVGQLGYVPAELEGSLLNQNTVVFSSNSNMLEQFYLFLLLQTDIYRDHLDLHAHGTANQASLNVSDMLDFKYPCPSLSEQIEIVDYIQNCNSKFDVLETCSEEAIKYLQERRTALISAAVTGKIDVRDWVAPDTQDVEDPQEATA